MTEIRTLRPGILVALRTSLTGNVSYNKRDIEAPHIVDGAERAKWETERNIVDPDEYERAKQVQGRAGYLVRATCIKSDHGLLCPNADADKLDAAIQEARALVEQFNATATTTRVSVTAMRGQIAQDDVEAVRAIKTEVRGLLRAMQEGLQACNVDTIREAANQANKLGGMLTPEAGSRIETAVRVARQAARKIAKAGEAAAIEVDQAAIRKINEQRTAFLDLDEERELAAPQVAGRVIDLDPETQEYDNLRQNAVSVEWDSDDGPVAAPVLPQFKLEL